MFQKQAHPQGCKGLAQRNHHVELPQQEEGAEQKKKKHKNNLSL